MKAYIIKDEDLERLKDKLSVDPKLESVLVRNDESRRMFEEVHRFYNYIICRWIDSIKE